MKFLKKIPKLKKGSVMKMTSTTDERTLAYINMYAILGGLTALCDIATEAGAILGRASCSIGFAGVWLPRLWLAG